MKTRTPIVSAPEWLRRLEKVQSIAPWLPFAMVLAWGWHAVDLLHEVPAYGDVLEGLWALLWYADSLRTGQSPAFYALLFHPGGWYVATYAWGPLNFLLLMPLYAIGGAAFAYNAATLISFGLAFGGSLLLAQRFLSRSGATVAALLFTFWSFRWYSIIGQLNIGLGSALLPWFLWSLEKGVGGSKQEASGAHRSRPFYVLAGALWAASVTSSLYFVWIGGVVLLGWLFGHFSRHGMPWRVMLANAMLVLVTAGGLSAPWVFIFWRANAAAAAIPFTIYDLNVLGASLNSLPIPSLFHPRFGSLAKALYSGRTDSEASLANLGSLATVLAIVGIGAIRRGGSRAWRPVLAIMCLGLVLALGLTLHWNGEMLQWRLMRPINELIWRVGRLLKPGFYFVGPDPVGAFREAIPLPGLILATLVPFFDSARLLARYALPAGMAVFLLAARGVAAFRWRLLRVALSGLLILEMMPSAVSAYPFPPPSHPAYEWLSQQSIAPLGIVQFSTQDWAHLSIPGGGEILWATRQHGQRTVGGASSIGPGHTAYLSRWLTEHAHPFLESDFATILRYYEVRYVLLHMHGSRQEEALTEAQQNEEMKYVRCFEATSSAQSWNSSICVFELLPSRTPSFNLILYEGWSGLEPWGRWIDGTEALASWVAMPSTAYRLTATAFPLCAPGRWQTATIEVNGAQVTSHAWNDCEPWSVQVAIPPDLVHVGSNAVAIQASYALSPNDATAGASPDSRSLSLGIQAFHVDRLPEISDAVSH